MINGVQIATAVIPQLTNRPETKPEGGRSSVSSAVQPYLSSRIRVDNLLNVAILEVRSTDTGDVIRQYPTEQQIQAFQRASEALADADQQRLEATVELTQRAPEPTTTQQAPVAQQQPVVQNTPPPAQQTQQVQQAQQQTAPAPQANASQQPATSAAPLASEAAPQASILV